MGVLSLHRHQAMMCYNIVYLDMYVYMNCRPVFNE